MVSKRYCKHVLLNARKPFQDFGLNESVLKGKAFYSGDSHVGKLRLLCGQDVVVANHAVVLALLGYEVASFGHVIWTPHYQFIFL